MGVSVRIAFVVLMLSGIGSVLPAPAAEAPVWTQYHLWGSFSPGAWKSVRLVTESLDERGQPTNISTTETTTTLTARDARGVTLLVEAVVELVDKRLTVVPRTVHQDYFGLSGGLTVEVKLVGKTYLEIDGRKVPVQIHQAEQTSPSGRTVIKIYFSDRLAPYVLRREIRSSDSAGNLVAETTSMVLAVGFPWKILSEVKQTPGVLEMKKLLLAMDCNLFSQISQTALVHTFHKETKGAIETWSLISTEVPGGVICQSSQEYDQTGRPVRRSSLELLDYGLQPSPEAKRGLFHRLRAKRAQKLERQP